MRTIRVSDEYCVKVIGATIGQECGSIDTKNSTANRIEYYKRPQIIYILNGRYSASQQVDKITVINGDSAIVNIGKYTMNVDKNNIVTECYYTIVI